MSEKAFYVPSYKGFSIFINNLKKHPEKLSMKETDLLDRFVSKPENTDVEEVEHKVRRVNALYSTRMWEADIMCAVRKIVNMRFDNELKQNGYSLVDKLRYIDNERPNKTSNSVTRIDHYSFATKYCHHCNPDKYPIYDRVNMNVLTVYLGYKDRRIYDEYIECYFAFCTMAGLDHKKHGFLIDKYIQAIGGQGRERLF